MQWALFASKHVVEGTEKLVTPKYIGGYYNLVIIFYGSTEQYGTYPYRVLLGSLLRAFYSQVILYIFKNL